MASNTQSSAAEIERPAWLVPLLTFVGVAGSVSVTGSILMFVLSLFGGSSAAPPGPVVAQPAVGTSSPATSQPPQASSTAQTMPPNVGGTTPKPAVEKAAPSTGSDPAPGPSPREVASQDPPPPAVDIAAVMKAKAKQIDFGAFATIKLPGEAKGFALDPASGRLAIVGPWEDQVGFLSAGDLASGSDSTKPQLVTLTGQPVAIVYVPRPSGGAFAVGTREPDGVTFLDAESLKSLKVVPVKLAFPAVLAASQNATVPYVYLTFVGTEERGRAKLGAARIDAERLEMDAQWENHEFRHISVSPDGQFIYTLPNNSGDYLTRSRPRAPGQAGDGGFRNSDRSGQWRTPTRYYIDPRGAIIAAGVSVYSADVTQLLMELDYDPLAIMGKAPWMAGLRQFDLVIGSRNDGRAVAEIALPGEFLIPDEKIRNRPITPRQETKIHPAVFAQLFADDERSRFVLGTRHQVVSLPLDKLELPDEPYLSLATTPPPTAIVDDAYEVSLATLSGSPEVELIKVPDGMTVEDGKLRWTPQDSDVGFVDVRVELKDGSVAHDEAWQLEVGQPKLDLPFAVLDCSPSEDGTRAVVWGNDWAPIGKVVNAEQERHPEPWIALVDLTTRKVLASRKLDFHVEQAVLTKHAIYATKFSERRTTEDTQPLIKLSAEDLSDLGASAVANGRIVAVADRYLRCVGTQARIQKIKSGTGNRDETYYAPYRSAYTLPDLKLVEMYGDWPRRELPALPRKLADGWLMDGLVWDNRLDQPRLLVGPHGFETALSTEDEANPDRFYWGFTTDLPLPRKDNPFGFVGSNGMYTPHIPALLTFDKSMPDFRKQPGPSSGRVHLDFKGLKSQEVVRSVTLRSGPWQQPLLGYQGGDKARIVTTPKHVVVMHSGEVFIVPAVGKDGPLPPPFRFELQQSAFVLSTTRPTKVTYRAEGAERFELALKALPDGVKEKLESTDGVFEIDFQKNEKLISSVALYVSGFINRNRSLGEEEYDRLESYITKLGRQYREIVGQPPTGVPVVIAAEVTAFNAKGAAVRMPHSYFVDIPKHEFDKYRPLAPAPKVASPSARPSPSENPPTRPAPKPDWRTAADYAQAFKQRMAASTTELDLDKLREDVAAADRKFLAGLGQSEIANMGFRNWTDTKGKQVRAALVERQESAIVVKDEGQRTFTIPLERLSEADQQWVTSWPMNPQVEMEVSVKSLRVLGAAFQKHHDLYGSFPPPGLMDAQRVSWRVLLLQQLGYDSLAAAFRYDEPWDSEHNRKLLPLMPAVYRSSFEVTASCKTPYQVLATSNSTMYYRFSTRLRDITDPASQTLLVMESSPAAAREWTRPADLPLHFFRKIQENLKTHDDYVLACLADASVAKIPINATDLDWVNLILINDGRPIVAELEIIPPSSAP